MADDPTSEPDNNDTPPDLDNLPDSHPLVKAYKATKADLAAARGKVKEIEDRDKSDLEKLQETLKEREAALSELPKQVRKQVLSFASAAGRRGFLDPEDALAFLDEGVDLSDTKAVDTALDDLAKRKPHLVRPQKSATSRPKPPKGDDAEDETDDLKGKERAAAALRQFAKR